MNVKAWASGCELSGHAMKKAGLLCGLCALIVALLMTGCAHKQPDLAQRNEERKTLVHKVIPDPARAEKILALMEQLDLGLTALNQSNQEAQQEFKRLNTDYTTTPDQFKEFMKRTGESRDKSRQKILDTYFEIKAITSQQEWEALFKDQIQALTDFLKKTEVPESK